MPPSRFLSKRSYKMHLRHSSLLRYLACLALPAALSGCAGGAGKPTLQPGGRAALQFSCAFPGGELAISSRPTGNSGAPLSPIYRERASSADVVVTAPSAGEGTPSAAPGSFEEDVVERIAAALPGRHAGETLALDLVAGRNPASAPLTLSRVRKRNKELRLSLEEYRSRMGKEPVLDTPFIIDPLVPGRVAEVADGTVLVRFSATPGRVVQLPFGKGTISEKEDRYEIDIDAKPGALVRSGSVLGRITEVSDQSFSIDLGHPFGGEALHCQVKINTLLPPEEPSAAPAQTPPAASAASDSGSAPALDGGAVQGAEEPAPATEAPGGLQGAANQPQGEH
jgi:hypothetical protein